MRPGVLESVEFTDLLQPSAIFLHLPSIRYLPPPSHQCSNKTHSFTWDILNENLNIMHNYKVDNLVL